MKTAASNGLGFFEPMIDTLDELVQCQREEQEMVLQRQTASLPAVCARIHTLTLKLERQQAAVESAHPERPLLPELEAQRQVCVQKFRLLQELALQNDLLLEHSLHFLQEIFRQTLGLKNPPLLYNEMGAMPSVVVDTGLLLNTKI